MQAPLFIHQYTQQLTGREAELRLQIDAMQRAAKLSGKTLEQFVQKFLSSPDQDFALQGELMQAMTMRWHHLSEAVQAFQNSALWERPLTFIFYFHTDIAASTLQHFAFGLPLTIEGAIYAFLGIIFGYLLFIGLRKIYAKLVKGTLALVKKSG